MSFDVDAVVDRRRLRRKLTFWRVLALLAIVAGIGWAVAAAGDYRYFGNSSPHVARVTIGGLIRSDRARLELLEEIGKSGAEAVIITINSPGGTVAGSEALYDGIRRLAEKKPTVAVIEGIAASGAYIAALGTDRIFAPRTAIVGSVGVIFQYPNFYELLKHVGVAVEEIKSSPLKASPNGYEPTSPEAKAAIRSLVDDTYGWFKNLVRERRSLDDAKLALASDGRVFSAAQAMPINLDRPDRRRACGARLAQGQQGRQRGSHGARLADPQLRLRVPLAWRARRRGRVARPARARRAGRQRSHHQRRRPRAA